MSTWVLLRGLMRESRHWGEFPTQFAEVMEGAVVVTLDFPGNGRLHTQASAISVAAMASSCHAQLTHLGHTPPYRVLALSLGAMVAVAWSRLYPDEVEKLVLINTSLAPYSPFYHRLRPQNYWALIGLLLTGSAAQREALILRLTTTQSHPGLLEEWIAYEQAYPISRVNILRQLFAAARFRAVMPIIPVLLLAGSQDQLVNPQCTLTLAEQWHCAIQLHPDAGHDLPLDDPAWVAQQVRTWRCLCVTQFEGLS
ncbi:MAG: alpha/beta hydrolase [Gallionella sp.]